MRVLFLFIWTLICEVTRWHYWHGNGLAIHRWRVRVLVRHHCVVPWAGYLYLYASVTMHNNLVPAKGSDLLWLGN